MSGRAGQWCLALLSSPLPDPMGEEHYAGGAPGPLAFPGGGACRGGAGGPWRGLGGEARGKPSPPCRPQLCSGTCTVQRPTARGVLSTQASQGTGLRESRPRGWDQGLWAWAGPCARGLSGQWAGLRSDLRFVLLLCSTPLHLLRVPRSPRPSGSQPLLCFPSCELQVEPDRQNPSSCLPGCPCLFVCRVGLAVPTAGPLPRRPSAVGAQAGAGAGGPGLANTQPYSMARAISSPLQPRFQGAS